jgi:hypothetical protein
LKILYIWDGRDSLPESRREAIEATLELYPDAEYSCITRNKHFVSDQFSIIPWDEILFQMLNHFGLRNVPYRWLEPMTFSDWARFWHLSHTPDTLYLDTDCRMLTRYDFQAQGKAMYSPGNICLLYTPKGFDGRHFLDLMEARAKVNIGLLLDFHYKMRPEWAAPAPADCFRHK